MTIVMGKEYYDYVQIHCGLCHTQKINHIEPQNRTSQYCLHIPQCHIRALTIALICIAWNVCGNYTVVLFLCFSL